MRRMMLGFAMVALAACQTAPEPPPPAPVAPAPQPALTNIPAAPGAAVMDPSVTVAPPDQNVPARYAAFSGRWAGLLDGLYEGKLAVLTVSAKGRVTVTYAWGTIADNRPGVADGQGRIVGNTMKIDRFPNGADTSFTMQPDGTLSATYSLAGQTYVGVFHLE